MTSEQHCTYIGDLTKSEFPEPLLKTPVKGIPHPWKKGCINGYRKFHAHIFIPLKFTNNTHISARTVLPQRGPENH